MSSELPADSKTRKLLKQLAKLESEQEHLSSEKEHLDEWLKSFGFIEGIKSLKEAARHLDSQENEENP